MKREFLEDHRHDHRSLFPSLHQLKTPPPSQETDTRSPKEAKLDALNADGATIEIVRRPRGRPPGSKNKPKQPLIITREVDEPSMSPYVLELPDGIDVVESIYRFCRRRGVGLAVLNGHGVVSNVTLKQPASPTATASVITFHGRFSILSLSATFLPTSVGNDQFTIFLGGSQGQVVGGLVTGPLIAAGTIYLIAATFNSSTIDRLQQEDNNMTEVEHNRDTVSGSPPGAVSGATATYQNSDVIWTPTARPQPPTRY